MHFREQARMKTLGEVLVQSSAGSFQGDLLNGICPKTMQQVRDCLSPGVEFDTGGGDKDKGALSFFEIDAQHAADQASPIQLYPIFPFVIYVDHAQQRFGFTDLFSLIDEMVKFGKVMTAGFEAQISPQYGAVYLEGDIAQDFGERMIWSGAGHGRYCLND